MQDTARPRITSLVESFIEVKTIKNMEWLACSPDLIPIKRVRVPIQYTDDAVLKDRGILLLGEQEDLTSSRVEQFSSNFLFDNFIASMQNRVPLRTDFTEINSWGKRGELLGRIDRQNSCFRTAKTIITKFDLQASFVELESAKNALNQVRFDQQLVSPKHPTHFQWGLDLENVLAIRDVEYPRCLDNPEQRVFDDMLRCRP
ncbi:hypothetical protein TNCV_1701261 [Trichonephila clavipes]|nr:hypothetical protein TNCV_1701261 [Trichonephila clavipes]